MTQLFAKKVLNIHSFFLSLSRFHIINIMTSTNFFVEKSTGQIVSSLPSVPCVQEVELKNYNKLDYHRSARKELRSRLQLEHRYNKRRGVFLTLTYDDRELPPDDDAVLKRNIQTFFKRLRVYQERKLHDHTKIKYVSVVERGKKNTRRLHHHCIVWGLNRLSMYNMCRSNSFGKNLWNKGLVNAKYIDGKGINYLIKYVFKDQEGRIYKVLRSRGIGFYKHHLRRIVIWSKDGTFRFGKYVNRIPLYYLKKIFGAHSSTYRNVLLNYHLKIPDKFDYKDILVDCISLNGNVFDWICRGDYKKYIHQIECNNYDIRIKQC